MHALLALPMRHRNAVGVAPVRRSLATLTPRFAEPRTLLALLVNLGDGVRVVPFPRSLATL